MINYAKLKKHILALDPDKVCRTGGWLNDGKTWLTASLSGWSLEANDLLSDIWSKRLPEKYGGDESFYDSLSTAYENLGQLGHQVGLILSDWKDEKNAWDDGTIQTGINRALTFLDYHKTQN